MLGKIDKSLLVYALHCCSNIDNQYIFDDVASNKEMYIGIVLKKRPKIGKKFTFYGINIKECSSSHISDITFDGIVQKTEKLHQCESIYYVSTDTQSAIIYYINSELASRKFSSPFLVHLYVKISENKEFDFDYLEKNNMLTLLYRPEICDVIDSRLKYYPIKSEKSIKLSKKQRFRTPEIYKLKSLPNCKNIYIAYFNPPTTTSSKNNYIIFYNNSCSLNQSKDWLIESNGHYCMLCGNYHDDIQWHHLLPRSQGGTNEYYNSSLLCPQCHKLVHVCQDCNPKLFKELTDKIIINKPRMRLIYAKLKNNVKKITI